jgi:hypothetical protein
VVPAHEPEVFRLLQRRLDHEARRRSGLSLTIRMAYVQAVARS